MENVAFVRDISREHKSFGRFLASWPTDDQVGLMAYLKKHGSRLGGQSAQWFMRAVGKDCFILTKDVVFALQEAGLDISDNPSTKRDLSRVQELMNAWREQSKLPYTHISKIAAYSVGENYRNEDLKAEIKKMAASL